MYFCLKDICFFVCLLQRQLKHTYVKKDTTRTKKKGEKEKS